MSIGRGSVEQRLAALEQLVEQLAASSQGEQLVPNYLTVNPNGTTGALFAGGVQLNEVASTSLYVPSSALAWLDSTGTMHALIQGNLEVGRHQLSLVSEADGNNFAEMFLESTAGGGNPARIEMELDAGAGLVQRTLLDSSLNSTFLQLLSSQKLQMQTGESTIALSTGVFSNFALPTAWPTAHLAFVASITPGPAAPTYAGSKVNNLSTGAVYFVGTNGTYGIDWISFGH